MLSLLCLHKIIKAAKIGGMKGATFNLLYFSKIEEDEHSKIKNSLFLFCQSMI